MAGTRRKTDVEVLCQRCKTPLGYVVQDGHKDWLCEKCADGKVTAVITEPKED